jgi:acyl carrier protein
MMVQEIERRVIRVIAMNTVVEQRFIFPESKLVGDLQLDSLDHVELMMDLEDEFSLIIPDEDFENITTVNDVTNYIDERLEKLGSTLT